MPIYEFRCENCGKVNEIYSRVSGKQQEVCRVCGGLARKIISAPGAVRAGDGKLTGIDDTDDLTIGKLVANRGIPAEHKREWNKRQARIKRVAEYERGLRERSKRYGFTPEEGDA